MRVVALRALIDIRSVVKCGTQEIGVEMAVLTSVADRLVEQAGNLANVRDVALHALQLLDRRMTYIGAEIPRMAIAARVEKVVARMLHRPGVMALMALMVHKGLVQNGSAGDR
jgi:hypothetical protein